MAQFSIEIADSDIERVLSAVVHNYKRPESIANPAFDSELPTDPDTNPETIPNAETYSQFTNRIVRQFLSENVRSYEMKEAKRIAAEEAGNNTSPEINDPELP
jgi:hypothetical protein